MPRRSTNPNSPRMFQLRLDPTNPTEKEMIEFFDNQSRWQNTMTFLIRNQMQASGTDDVFTALAMGATPVTPVASAPKAEKPVAKPVPQSSASQPVQTSEASSVAAPTPSPAPQAQPSQAPQQPVENFNPFAGNSNNGSNAGANLKANNDSFRDLM